ncbi:MAG: peptide deformylase [Sulfurimonas sp.]|uniref:peptide deformylase n=1 Tax=Sulfurimonas sp. TaxID=2022749 RepID=UPI0025E14CDC|nr:peptide deformylase [Sulfurimonas sp.]MCK9455034.1 peptide deformylase [Sulfurimonas sp.]
MKLKIVEYPDKKLKEKSKSIEVFNKELHQLLDDMYETMIGSNGIGLAAIQVGHTKRALLINIPDENDEQSVDTLIEMINPVITHTSGVTTYQEGCLSVPSFYEDINRYESITVNYQDRDGNTKIIEADNLLSIAIQHEIDHLDGILFIDKLSYSRRKKFEKEYKRMQKEKKLHKL